MQSSLGNIFGEHIVRESRRSHVSSGKQEGEKTTQRFLSFLMVLVLGMGVLLARLFGLTVLEGERYRALGQENRIRKTQILAPRGIIYDRNKIPLVGNIPMFVAEDGRVFFEKKPPFFSESLKENVTRDYKEGENFANVIGYVGEISEEELEKDQRGRYGAGDIIGKTGVEKQYDGMLRGINGSALVEVDAVGKLVRTLGKVSPHEGNALTLTVDADMQKIAKKEMEGKRGAVVVSIPQTGEILALVSSPSFDPNRLIRGENVEEIFEDPSTPLFDRVTGGVYPPGSTFKIVTAVAALESHAIVHDTLIEDTGVLTVGKYSYGNWYFNQYGRKEGAMNIVTALKRSNDIFFYKAGEATGIETIAGWARTFGLGSPLGIDLPGEASGTMPDPDWMKQQKNETWYLGNTYHVAIGQGDVLATPLQVNAMTNVIATAGTLCPPHLVKRESSDGKSGKCRNLEIGSDTIEVVREGMKEACAPRGTGWPLFEFRVPAAELEHGKGSESFIDGDDFRKPKEATRASKPEVEIPIACKTGTAEFGDPSGKTHAWITAFAPVKNPQLSVTVLVEQGGEGSSIAGPIAKRIFSGWFSGT